MAYLEHILLLFGKDLLQNFLGVLAFFIGFMYPEIISFFKSKFK